MTHKTIILIAFILLKFLLQYLLISPEYDLQRDEYLHLDMANHLAWGYLSVPPLTSWISYLIRLLGNSVFWVKFFPALFGALTLVMVWKTVEALKGGIYALVLAATCVLFSVLLRLNTLYQPNSFDVLAWTAFYFIVVKYFSAQNPRWLFVGAIVFALGLLNKYNVAFLLVGMFPALLLTGQRRLFSRKSFYIAALLALLLVHPNLLWQYQNGFPVIYHLRQLSELHLVNVDRLGFLRSQLLFFVGSLIVLFSGYIQRHSEAYRALGLLRWEDGKDHALPQDFADMLGWSELAAKVDSIYSRIPSSEPTLVLCDNYGQAGAINYYSRQGDKSCIVQCGLRKLVRSGPAVCQPHQGEKRTRPGSGA